MIRIILAGLPATTQLSGTSLTTTEPAPTVTLLPIVIPPIIVTEAPNLTLFPMVGLPFFPHPKVVQCAQLKLEPIFSAFKTVEYG